MKDIASTKPRVGTWPRPMFTIERVVADMKPMDAVRFLIRAYDQLAGSTDEHAGLGISLGMTPGEAQVFGLLHRRSGCMVSHGTLLTLIENRTEGGMDATNVLRVYIAKIRTKLEGTGMSIRTVWGAGYCLEGNLRVEQ